MDYFSCFDGIGLNRLEADFVKIAAKSCISTTCNAMLRNVEFRGFAQSRLGRTLTQNHNSLIHDGLRQPATDARAKTVANSEFPPDLRQIIRHWNALPAEVKQTILTLIKHSRRRKTAKAL